MALKVGAVALAFNVTPQTVRNWVNHPELSEFFSSRARRDDGQGQAEFLAQDLEVCNSIKVLLRQKKTFDEVAEALRAGWRDTDMPANLMIVDEELQTASSFQMMTSLAVSEANNNTAVKRIETLEDELRAARAQLDSERNASAARIRELEKQVFELEKAKAVADAIERRAVEDALVRQELEWRRKGMLKDSPDGGEGQ